MIKIFVFFCAIVTLFYFVYNLYKFLSWFFSKLAKKNDDFPYAKGKQLTALADYFGFKRKWFESDSFFRKRISKTLRKRDF